MRDPDKPQQIIEAAVRVFARKGYYNSRVSDIAREAVRRGTIYLYQDQDDILVTLFRDKMADFVGVLRKAIAASPTPPQGTPARVAAFLHPRGDPDPPRSCRWSCARTEAFRGASSQEIGPRPDRLGARGGRGRGCFRSGLPVKVATKILFKHGPDGHVLGARQARLPAWTPRRRRRDLPPGRRRPHVIGDRQCRTIR